jgi:hypothetical protein
MDHFEKIAHWTRELTRLFPDEPIATVDEAARTMASYTLAAAQIDRYTPYAARALIRAYADMVEVKS